MKNFKKNISNQHLASLHTSTLPSPHPSPLAPRNPWFITGFSDAESCFYIKICKCNKLKAKWRVQVSFNISLHEKDRALLELIQSNLGGVGKIYKSREQAIQLQVNDLKDLTEKIIPHFEQYPLVSQKQADFNLFKLAIDLMNRKEHLTPDGLQEIVNLKASMNNGLSDELKYAFPNTIPVPRPAVEFSGRFPRIQGIGLLASQRARVVSLLIFLKTGLKPALLSG